MLGSLEVRRDGQRLALGGRQQRAVLAVLLAEADHPVSALRLADAIWPEKVPAGSVGTIQTYVFHLREILEPDHIRGEPWTVLVSEAGGYRLELDGNTADVREFEAGLAAGRAAMTLGNYDDAELALGAALSLWRDDVLVDLGDLPFLEPVAARLSGLRIHASELHLQCQLELGRHAAVVGELDRLITEHPLREELHAQRILALYRCGRQSEALAAYRDLRRVLGEELGVEPSLALRQLNQAVLVQDPALDWVPSLDTSRGGPVPPTTDGSAPSESEPGVRSASRRRRFGGLTPQGRPIIAVAGVCAVVAAAGGIAGVVDWSSDRSASSLAADSVGLIDEHGALGPSVRVGAGPDAITYGDGAVWVASRTAGSVAKIDPSSHQVIERIPVGPSPSAVTVTNHDLWVANFGDGTVLRISTSTYRVLQTIVVGNQPTALASGPSGVWVANYGDDTIQRIDPATGQAGRGVSVGHGPEALAVDRDSVWVAAALDDTLREFNAKTLQQGAPIAVPSGPRDIAVTASDIWVTNQLSQSVTRVDRRSRLPITLRVGDGPHSVQVSRGAAWVSNEFDGTITRVDTRNNSTRTFAVGSSPRGLTVVNGRVWAAVAPFAEKQHRGGTLTSVNTFIPGGPGTIDPAVVGDPLTGPVERYVYDGLLAIRLSAGQSAQSIVPDLAVAIPSPADGNRTYTFTVRPNIRYSTGQVVHASDFRIGLLKALTIGPVPQMYAGIEGALLCIRDHGRCDLSRGLMTDDARGTVTFHLTEPDAEFLYKLTELVYPMPPGTAATESKTPLPGTGPYRIARYETRKHFTLTRNPYFRQWSFAAQPAGYPDVIDWLRVEKVDQAVQALSAGRADVVELGDLSPARMDEVAARSGNQFQSYVLQQTSLATLNPRRAPFNDLRVRRALNLAVDRRRLIDIQGGAHFASLTCQFLPPNFPSYHPYCPFTSPSADGQYQGPNKAEATSLIRQSRTAGTTVHLASGQDPIDRALADYLATVLRSLGFRTSVRVEEPPQPSRQMFVSRFNGWIADFPEASTFFDNVFSCRAQLALLVKHCHDAIGQVADRAHAAQTTDPQQAGKLWAEVDRQLTDEAQFVALGNLVDSQLVSSRVGNFQTNSALGPLFSQIWVK
jgi:ABC-type transport system substrate-binding protein/DNA-binding SARP family transcriptional activator/streptogramin lyase